MIDRHDLTDSEWAVLEPGSPWRDLPEQFGNWKTAYMRHRRWSADGTWERVLDELRRGCDDSEGSEWMLVLDSPTARAHQHGRGVALCQSRLARSKHGRSMPQKDPENTP